MNQQQIPPQLSSHVLRAMYPSKTCGGVSLVESDGYHEGFVQCCDCQNLESYWKNGNVAFFLCRQKPVAMKTLYQRWRRCKFFVHTTQSPLERRNDIK